MAITLWNTHLPNKVQQSTSNEIGGKSTYLGKNRSNISVEKRSLILIGGNTRKKAIKVKQMSLKIIKKNKKSTYIYMRIGRFKSPISNGWL